MADFRIQRSLLVCVGWLIVDEFVILLARFKLKVRGHPVVTGLIPGGVGSCICIMDRESSMRNTTFDGAEDSINNGICVNWLDAGAAKATGCKARVMAMGPNIQRAICFNTRFTRVEWSGVSVI